MEFVLNWKVRIVFIIKIVFRGQLSLIRVSCCCYFKIVSMLFKIFFCLTYVLRLKIISLRQRIKFKINRFLIRIIIWFYLIQCCIVFLKRSFNLIYQLLYFCFFIAKKLNFHRDSYCWSHFLYTNLRWWPRWYINVVLFNVLIFNLTLLITWNWQLLLMHFVFLELF